MIEPASRHEDGPALFTLRDGRRVLLGMDWFPLLGRQTATLARQRARFLGATHYVHGAPGVAAAGCVRWAGAPLSSPVYSAAQAVADRYPDGAVLIRLALSSGRVWLVAALDGAVVSGTDRVYALEQEPEVLAALRARYPGIQTHTLASQGTGETSVSDGDAMMAVADMLGSECMVQRLRSRWLPGRTFAPGKAGTAVRRRALGLRSLGVMALLLGLLGTAASWSHWRSGRVPPVSVAKAKQSATLAGDTRCHTRLFAADIMPMVLKDLLTLPLHPAGWTLTHVQCRHDATGSWQCDAQYRRTLPQATNASLRDAVLSEWQASFLSLDLAQWRRTWPLPTTCLPSPRDSIRSSQAQAIVLGSRLQHIRPAFEQITLGPLVSEPSSFGASRTVVSGADEVSGRDATDLSHRLLTVQGPLRSAGLLFDLPGPVIWRHLTLTHDSRLSRDIRRSALTLALQGLVYENASLH